MLDRYLWSNVDRISPEAPVPIAKIEKESFVPGGAANTAYNLSFLDVNVDLIGITGDDMASSQLGQLFEKQGIGTSGLLVDQSRPTTVKTRIMAGNYQVLRFDYEQIQPIDTKLETKLMGCIKKSLDGTKVIIISDYSKGLISTKLARNTIALAKKQGVRVLVDPTPQSFLKYKNSYLIKPNKKEAEELVGEKIKSDYSNLKSVGQRIINRLKVKIAFITLGKDGIAVLNNNGTFFMVPTAAREVYDVSGAGDTTMATLAAGLSCGASLRQAAVLANTSAGIVVSKLGTAICTRAELIANIKKYL